MGLRRVPIPAGGILTRSNRSRRTASGRSDVCWYSVKESGVWRRMTPRVRFLDIRKVLRILVKMGEQEVV